MRVLLVCLQKIISSEKNKLEKIHLTVAVGQTLVTSRAAILTFDRKLQRV